MASLQDIHPDIQVARSLAEQGVPIFVAPPDDSKVGFALPRGWEATTADPAALDAWQPGWAVCAVMGVACDALDVDPRHGGDKTQAGLERAGLWPRSYGRASTPSGGTHDLIARTHAGKGSKDGVDLQAGSDDGTGRGFIFIAPTERPSKVTGEILPYRWTVEPDVGDTEGDDSAEGLIPLFAKAEKSREAYVLTGDVAGETEVRQRALQLARHLREAPDGEGNNTAASVATYMGNYVAAGQISKEEAIGLLLNAIEGWDFRYRKDRDAMRDTIIRQVEFGMKTVRPWEAAKSVDFTEEVAATPEGDEKPSAIDLMIARMIDRDAMTNMVPPEPLIKDFLDRKTMARLNGASNAGKSFVALDMAGCVSQGIPWHGQPVKRGKVIYLVAEGLAGIRKRVHAWEQHNGQKMENVLFFPGAVQVNDSEWSVFVQACRQVGADFIVLDTQARITAGIEENSNSDMGEVVKRIDALKDATGACVMLVHHTGHEGQRARGASAMIGAMDHEFVVDKSADNVVRLKTTKQKDREYAPDKRFRMEKVGEAPEMYEEDERSIVLVDWSPDEAKSDLADVYNTEQGRLFEMFDLVGEGTKSEIKALYTDTKSRVPGPKNKDAFYRAWKALEARGHIRPTKGGKANGWVAMSLEERIREAEAAREA